jgi:hypothetical protein
MHPENLLPLIGLWPLVVVMVVGFGAFLRFEGSRRKRDEQRMIHRERNYWKREMAYRVRMRVKDWLSRTKTPRLTYQGPPLSSQPPKVRRRK